MNFKTQGPSWGFWKILFGKAISSKTPNRLEFISKQVGFP
jgi:hypothetical protein